MFDNVLELEDETRNPAFVDWMVRRGFAIRRLYSQSGYVTDFEVRTKSSTFRTISRDSTQEESDVLRDDIRSEYDYFVEENNKRVLNTERSHKRVTPPAYARQFEMATVKSATSQ